MFTPWTTSIDQDSPEGSELAFGGLVFGIGLLDAEEVLRYMDATFLQRANHQDSREKGSDE